MLSAKHLLDILLESNQPFNIVCPWRINVRSQSLKLRLNCWFCCKEFTKLQLFQFFFRLKKERIKIHEQLAISIILVQVMYLVGIDRTENKVNILITFILPAIFYYPVKLTLYVNFSFPFSMSVCRWPYYCTISFWLCSAGCSWKDSICTFCLCRSSKQTAISESTWRLVGVIFSHKYHIMNKEYLF